MKYLILVGLFFGFGSGSALASDRVARALDAYDQHIAGLRMEFGKVPENALDKSWVKAKLDFMFDIDQYTRFYWRVAFDQKFSDQETALFNQEILARTNRIDQETTSDLKKLLKIHHWFKISEWTAKYDRTAWLIVQHSDLNPDFQKEVLVILEKLYPIKETSAANYAYLFDRVALSARDPTKKVPQRYGTQGRCVGPGKWKHWPTEDEANLEKRRKEMGLSTMEEYQKLFKDICTKNEDLT